MGLFDSAGLDSAKEIHRMADELMDKANGLLDKTDTVAHSVQVRLSDLAHGVIDRFQDCEFHFTFKIRPAKAIAANPPPE